MGRFLLSSANYFYKVIGCMTRDSCVARWQKIKKWRKKAEMKKMTVALCVHYEPLQTRQSAWRALLIIGFCSPSSMFENVLRLDQRCLAYLHLTYCQTFLRLSRALQARMFAFCAFFCLFLGRRGVWTGLRGMKEQLARDVDGVTRI